MAQLDCPFPPVSKPNHCLRAEGISRTGVQSGIYLVHRKGYIVAQDCGLQLTLKRIRGQRLLPCQLSPQISRKPLSHPSSHIACAESKSYISSLEVPYCLAVADHRSLSQFPAAYLRLRSYGSFPSRDFERWETPPLYMIIRRSTLLLDLPTKHGTPKLPRAQAGQHLYRSPLSRSKKAP